MKIAVDLLPAVLAEGAASIFGVIKRRAQHPDFLIVVWIDANLAVIGRARIGVAHARPGEALIFGAVDAAFLDVLHQRVNDVGILAGDIHRATSDVASRREAFGELVPVSAAVDGLVDSAARPSAVESEYGTPAFVGRGIKRVRALRIDGDVGNTGVLIDEERLRPGNAAVGGFEYAAFFVRPPKMAQRRNVDDIGIGRMNDNAADVTGFLKAHVRPGAAGVHGFINSVAPRRALAIVRLAGAHPEDGGVRGRQREVTDG